MSHLEPPCVVLPTKNIFQRSDIGHSIHIHNSITPLTHFNLPALSCSVSNVIWIFLNKYVYTFLVHTLNFERRPLMMESRPSQKSILKFTTKKNEWYLQSNAYANALHRYANWITLFFVILKNKIKYVALKITADRWPRVYTLLTTTSVLYQHFCDIYRSGQRKT